jgi:monofunctional biosynthetic peptidoglycan transglycosylase
LATTAANKPRRSNKRKPATSNGMSKLLSRAGKPSGRSKKKDNIFLRVYRFILWLIIYSFAASLTTVIVFKWTPPLFTPLMVMRKTEAFFKGKDTIIYYSWTPIDKMDPDLAVAVVAAEDQKFPKHYGFDARAIAEAIESNTEGKIVRGGSTISQQVAKNMFLWPGKNFVRKGLEAYFTCLIEIIWGKKRILEVYLNIAETGNMTFGFPAAAKKFLKTPPDRVSALQAARLAAVLPNPRVYAAQKPSPYVYKRISWISKQMHQLGGKKYLKGILEE